MERSKLSTTRMILMIAVLALSVYAKYKEAHASHEPVTAASIVNN